VGLPQERSGGGDGGKHFSGETACNISAEPAELSKVFFDKNSKRVWHGRAGEVAGTRGEVLRLMALGHRGWLGIPHTLPKMKISLNTLGGTGSAMACPSAPAKAPRATT
jgi:hypothetical protein